MCTGPFVYVMVHIEVGRQFPSQFSLSTFLWIPEIKLSGHQAHRTALSPANPSPGLAAHFLFF